MKQTSRFRALGLAAGIGLVPFGNAGPVRAEESGAGPSAARPGSTGSVQPVDPDSCSSKSDCKGERVCDAGECVTRSEGDGETNRVERKRVTAFNAVLAELLGPGLFYSLNYERRFEKATDFTGRFGFSSAVLDAPGGSKLLLLTFPITFGYIGIGDLRNKFEIGVGGVLILASAPKSASGTTYASSNGVGGAATVLAGYRYQREAGGFQFRLGLSPLAGTIGLLPTGYLSLGTTF